jgi:cysteine-rich repeat protein
MNRFRRHFDRLDAWLIATSVIVAGAVALTHCSSSPVCGNNVTEDGEQCDKGMLNGVENSGCSSTCQIAALNIAGLEVFVTRLKNEAMGYPGNGCSELGAAQQHIVLTGPMNMDMTVDCNMTPGFLNHDVPLGDYTAAVTLLDSGGIPITNTVTGTTTATNGQTAMITVNFAQSDFLKQDYTGTLFFTPEWGASSTSCSMANPSVTAMGITLKDKDGEVVSKVSTGNHTTDGTQGPCFMPGANGTAEGIASLTWGHYTLTLTGYNNGTLSYCKAFDVFSGPGTANATYDLMVSAGAGDADAGSACP